MAHILVPHGYVEWRDPAGQVIAEADTLQCCHCGGHFAVVKGSGKIRGFCLRCMGPVCGPACAECVPEDQMLSNIELGKPPGYRRIQVAGGWGG